MPFFCMPSSKKPGVKKTTQIAPKPAVPMTKPTAPVTSTMGKPTTTDEQKKIQQEKDQLIDAQQKGMEMKKPVDETGMGGNISQQKQVSDNKQVVQEQEDAEIEEDLQSQDQQEKVPLLQHVIESVLELDSLTIKKNKIDLKDEPLSPSTGIGDCSPHGQLSGDLLKYTDSKDSTHSTEPVHGSSLSPETMQDHGELENQEGDSTTGEKTSLSPSKKQSKFFQCCTPAVNEELETTTIVEEVGA